MEAQLQEQANKLQRYETKLKDIIAAYKTLQIEKEDAQERLRVMNQEKNHSQVKPRRDESGLPQHVDELRFTLSEALEKCEETGHSAANLRNEPSFTTSELQEQNKKCATLTERIKNVEALLVNLQKQNEQSSEELQCSRRALAAATERIVKITKELRTGKEHEKQLQAALEETQNQHEASTLHFETRLSDLTATLKTYKNLHTDDVQLIEKLRSKSAGEESDDFNGNMSDLSKFFVKVMLSINSNRIDKDQLLTLMETLWKSALASMENVDSGLQDLLVARLELNRKIPSTPKEGKDGYWEKHKECLREREELAQELNETTSRLNSLQDSFCKVNPSAPKLSKVKPQFGSPTMTKSIDFQLQEAQEHVQLLRNQNLTTLLELEALKKSYHSRITSLENDIELRLSEATSRHEIQLAHVQTEARKYREQTLNLLTDKEEEIAELRTALCLTGREQHSSHFNSPNLWINRNTSPTSPHASILPDSSTSFPEQSHCDLVHCSEQYGRLMMEVKQLRRTKSSLEKQLVTLEAQGREDRRALLAASRGDSVKPFNKDHEETTNMAYVRNVVFNLLTSYRNSSLTSRQAMVKALVMALQFSGVEENALLHGVIL